MLILLELSAEAGRRTVAEDHGALLSIAVGETAWVVHTPTGSGFSTVDMLDPASLAALEADSGLDNPAEWDLQLQAAMPMSQAGIQFRDGGDPFSAWACQRFALLVALRTQQPAGAKSMARNLWMLRASIEAWAADPQLSGDDRVALQGLQQALIADARLLLPRAEALGPSGDPNALVAWHRVADLAYDKPSRERALIAIRDRGTTDAFALANLEELGGVDLTDVLATYMEPPPADATNVGARFEGWSMPRSAMLANPSDEALATLSAVTEHLGMLRSEAIRAGGPFGQQQSYRVARVLNPLVQDLAFALVARGESDLALTYAEQAHSRALVDWMGRTHPTDRLRITGAGSVGEARVADLEEIRAFVADQQVTAVVYMNAPDGYQVWAVPPSGPIVTTSIGFPHLKALFATYPYASSVDEAAQMARGGRIARGDTATTVTSTLYTELLPGPIAATLPADGGTVVFITDGSLDNVPFSALQGPDGRLLVERVAIHRWPSFTGALMLEGADVRQLSSPAGPPVVVGGADFTGTTLAPLPGTRTEAIAIAEQLGVKPILGPDATFDTLRSHPRPGILHLASHGILNRANPLDSYIALTGGRMTAADLYAADGEPWAKADLVVLSACQTGVGDHGPDSPIGLQSGLLVAGANTVVTSLWEVDDLATAALMKRFYAELKAGKDVPHALREAELSVMHTKGWEDPYYWAAFGSMGRIDAPVSASPRP